MGTEDPKALLGGLPETRDELLAHAGWLDEQGRTDEATRLLEKACLRTPSTPLRKSLAAFYKKNARLDDCLAILDDILSRHPDDIPTLQLFAEAQLAVGDIEGARRSRARLKDIGVSRRGLLRLSLKLEKARAKASSEAVPSEPESATDRPAAKTPAGPPSLPIPRPGKQAEGGDAEPDSPCDAESTDGDDSLDAEDVEANAGASAFYVGPTRVASLSAPNEERQGAPALRPGSPSLQQSLSEFFANHRVASDDLEPEEPIVDAEQQGLAEVESKPYVLEELTRSEAAPESSESSTEHVAARGEISKERRAKLRKRSARGTLMGLPTARPDDEAHASGADEPQNPFFAELDGADRVDEASEPIEDSEASELSDASEQPEAPESPDAVFDDLAVFDSDETTEYHPEADSVDDVFDALDHQATTEFESGDSSSLTDLIESVEAKERATPAAEPPVDTGEDEQPPPEADAEGEQVLAEESVDVIDRSVADAPEDAVGRDRMEASQRTDVPLSVEPPGSPLWNVLLATLILLVVGTAGTGMYAMKSLGDVHEQILAEAREQRAEDTYQGYLEAADTLETMSDATSFAGPQVDDYLADFGLASERVSTSREEAAVQLALINAMVEFRYEHMGSRNADDYLTRARDIAGDSAELAAAGAYRLMAGGERQKAREALSKARLDYSRSRDLAAASIELELASGRPHAADHAAGLLRDTTEERVYFDYLLGRIELAKMDPAAEDVFRGILEHSSPDHLSARISQSYAIRLGEPDPAKLDEARALVESTLDGMGAEASPLQQAKAHVARGHIAMAEEAFDQAGPHFERAVELSPTRAGLHIDLVEYYVATEQAEKALEQVEVAEEKVGKTDSLCELQARALYQRRRCEGVIEALADISEPSHRSKFLAGRCYLEIGAPAAARRAFEAAAELDENTPIRAKALELVAHARSATQLDDGWLPIMDSLVDKSDGAPELLRARALLRLEFAEAETERREQRAFFEDAIASLEKAADARAGWRVVPYDLCRAHMRLGDAAKASAYCNRGRELDPLYRPGMTTAIELALLRGEHDAAVGLAEALAAEFPDAPDVRLARVRSLVAHGEIEAAAAQNERWGTGPDARKAAAGLARGLVAFERGDFPAATAQFEVAHKATPHLAEPAVRYAWAAAMQGDDVGEDILEHRLSDPLWGARAWHALGDLRLRQERFNTARQNYAEALERYRNTIAPTWRLSETYAGLARAWANLQGWNHYMTRRYVSRASSRADGDSVPARYLSGVYHFEKPRSDLDRAAQRFEYVVERKPYHCGAVEYLLGIYDRKGADDDRERIDELSAKYCQEG
jgi:predicted Zn-dependent protease